VTASSPVHSADLPSPSLFEAVVGQPGAVAALRVAARRPVHAYLLSGPAGSGSRPAAVGFAAALLCPNGGCGDCPVCRRVLAGTHPDLVVVERTGAALGVDQARQLVGLAQRRPLEAQRQVIVVTEVHLALRSAPALLKTVEEPPASTVFVLLANALPPELATVASRCVTVSFPPVPRAAVEQWLVSRGTPPALAGAIAEGAAGDVDRARLLADDPGFAERLVLWRSVPDALDGRGATAAERARALLAAIDAGLEPLRAAHAAEVQRLTEEAETFGERGLSGRRELIERQHREERRWRTDELRIGLGVLARAYRDRLADAVAARSDAGSARRARADEQAVDLLTAVTASLEHNPNELLLLEALLVRLGALADGG
jgi:DNA polymerase-3 subunit delta'